MTDGNREEIVIPRTRVGGFLRAFRRGVVKGLRTAVWLAAFMAPVSLIVTLADWIGLLPWLVKGVAPLFDLLGVPAESAAAFVAGALLNAYSGIAALGPIPLTDRQVTILAVMILISHNLPIEVTIQSKAGASGVKLLLIRLVSSFAMGFLLNLILPASTEAPVTRGATQAIAAAETFWALMGSWALGTALLMGKIALFVIGVMVLQELLNAFRLMGPLTRVLAWPLALLGLPRETVFLWIVANTLGLAFGAAVILEESRSGRLSKDEIRMVNRSVAVCHSLLEDTFLFVAIGAWALWITLPRIAVAAAVVWAYRLTHRVSDASRSAEEA